MRISNIIALALIAFLSGVLGSQLFAEPIVQGDTIINKEEQVYIQENDQLMQNIKDLGSVVVEVTTPVLYAHGCGVVLTSDGLIVTTADIIPIGYDFEFRINKEQVSYKVLKRDYTNNLALIKIEKQGLKTVGFYNKEISLGERVFSVSLLEDEMIVNEGIIKKISEGLWETNMFDVYHIDGSPVFNIENNLIGIISKNKYNLIDVIPVSVIKEFAGL